MGNGMLIVSNVEMNWSDRLLDIHHKKIMLTFWEELL